MNLSPRVVSNEWFEIRNKSAELPTSTPRRRKELGPKFLHILVTAQTLRIIVISGVFLMSAAVSTGVVGLGTWAFSRR